MNQERFDHTFPGPGTYDVIATVTGSNCEDPHLGAEDQDQPGAGRHRHPALTGLGRRDPEGHRNRRFG